MSQAVQDLLRVLCTDYRDDLNQNQRQAFDGMRDLENLSQKQEQWVYAVAERFGLTVAPATNVFSEMSEKKQREHLERAAKVKLPWEKSGYARPAKPPGRG